MSESDYKRFINLFTESLPEIQRIISEKNSADSFEIFIRIYIDIYGERIVNFNQLPYSLSQLRVLSRYQRSMKYSGLYVNNKIKRLIEKKYCNEYFDEKLYNDYINFLNNITNEQNIRKKIVNRYINSKIIGKSLSTEDIFNNDFKTYKNRLDEKKQITYYSYLLKKEYKFETNYRTILDNDLNIFFNNYCLKNSIDGNGFYFKLL
jgi:hypothetical protein